MSEPVIELASGETAIIGFGSLLSLESVRRTVGKAYAGPFVFCHLEGWRRVWNVSMPNESFYYEETGTRIYPERIIYLNVRPDPATRLNCVLFVVNASQLAAMHEREWIYDPQVVTADLRGVQVQGGEAYVYVGRAGHLVHTFENPRAAAIRGSYFMSLEKAMAKTSPEFQAEYEATTDPLPEHLLIDDQLDPARPSPWAAAGRDYAPE